jgi:hypothetical protein
VGAARIKGKVKLWQEDESSLAGSRAADDRQLPPRGGEL